MREREAEGVRAWLAGQGFVGCEVRDTLPDARNRDHAGYGVALAVNDVPYLLRDRAEAEEFVRGLLGDETDPADATTRRP